MHRRFLNIGGAQSAPKVYAYGNADYKVPIVYTFEELLWCCVRQYNLR